MKVISLSLPEVKLVEPKVFNDERGFFLESYHSDKFEEQGIEVTFVQDNHSCSQKGVIRGLHCQKAPFGQAKLVRVVKGAIFDVAVDIRPESKTFGQWVGETLTAENKKMLYIPADFAHGFSVLEEGTEVLYKASNTYSPEHEFGVIWNDPDIGIKWPEMGQKPIISAKDSVLPPLKKCS